MVTVGLFGIRDTSPGPTPTYTHDHGLALMRGGKVLGVLPLERWTRRKHDNTLDEHFPRLLARFLPDGEPVRFVSVNSFVGDGFQTRDGSFRIEPLAPVAVQPTPVRARVHWFPDGHRRREAEGYALCHELAHLGSLLPFTGRFAENSLLAHVDGGASDSACSFWRWDGRQAILLERSWDRLKTPLANFNSNPLVFALLGLAPEEHLAAPGKLMGYAGHGHADPELLRWLEAHRFFLGVPHGSPELLSAFNEYFGTKWSFFDPRDQRCRDLAATLQAHFEDSVFTTLLDVHRLAGTRHLYLAGGAGLNIPTNTRLETCGAFASVHVPPCTNDTGLALGAAAWIEFLERGEVEPRGPFLAETGETLPAVCLGEIQEIASRLAEGQVLGMFEGAAEIGPRALGHRSIMARPDFPELRRRVSETIKRREWYRPVAPVVREDLAEQAFGRSAASSPLARYMLGAFRVQASWRPAFAGVLHADGTARLQVVSSRDPELTFLHALLGELWDRHLKGPLIFVA